eukprot:TRINITY_DN5970_c0_g1_i1.p1 TRINITY_DN5970_c0_g1~~TRINITY_DN5970_c0_g1_i1.p1  ORF type:complete len:316 (+),score=34.88 TRINITY_DN5970_c0_g1_i1:93-1040(+)
MSIVMNLSNLSTTVLTYLPSEWSNFWLYSIAIIAVHMGGFNPLLFLCLYVYLTCDPAVMADVVAGLSPLVGLIVVPFVLVVAVYWVNGFMLLALEQVPALRVLFRKYKIQQKKDLDMSKFGKLCKNLIVGQVFVILPHTGIFYLLSTNGIGVQYNTDIPSPRRVVGEFLVYIVLNEFLFYYGHKLLHTKALYGPVHKIHHEFTSPIGLAAAYCHPIEMVISNIIPLAGGALLLKSHITTLWIWICLVVIGTQTHHCGYRLPTSFFYDEQPDFHDFHHEKFHYNFGLLGWLDAWHGTDKLWQERVKQHKEGKSKSN